MAKDKEMISSNNQHPASFIFPHILLLYVFILIGLCGLGSCVTEDAPTNSGIVPGNKLPEFSIIMNDGSVITTASLKGKLTVIELFNTGCSDCRRSLPVMESLYQEWKDNAEVKIFAIAREEVESEIAAYWNDNNLTLPYSPQPDRKIYELFATVGIPRIYIADRTGTVIAAFGPEDNPTLSQLSQILTSN